MTVTTSEEDGSKSGRRAGAARRNLGSQVSSLMSAGNQKGAGKRISNNRLGFSVD
jgi:hypothetical protein